MKLYKQMALSFVGVPKGEDFEISSFSAFLNSMLGDLKLFLGNPKRAKAWPHVTEYILAEYALNKRKALFIIPFQRLMGYWHTFHFPFAIFMYVIAFIHVVVALLLGV